MLADVRQAADPIDVLWRQDRRTRRRRWVIGTAVAAIALAALAATTALIRSSGRPAGAPPPPVTATVTRATLSATTDVDGTLGFGDAAPLTASAAGVVTWLPPIGSTITRGQALFRVDEQRVVLFYGSVPLYRTMGTGDKGADVAEIEQNLRALGYTGFTVDDTFTDATATVVRRLQHDLAIPETGTVGTSWAVVARGAIRVAGYVTALGGTASGGVLLVTGGTKIVTAQVDAANAGWAKVGGRVTVLLPDGSEAAGVIGGISSTVTPASSSGESPEPTIAVTVTIPDQSSVAKYAESPVRLRYITEQHSNVLTAPVAALLALAEGGYGLETVHNGVHTVVPVQVGLVADGQAEVSGLGITDGTVVVIPG